MLVVETAVKALLDKIEYVIFKFHGLKSVGFTHTHYQDIMRVLTWDYWYAS